ncbi:glycosyltransferase [Desulfovibrio sp. OttesenSCG-928-G15]|nr:glycosyltransferase [Desulfovibrio sp. OttesenSCG-928-G15]
MSKKNVAIVLGATSNYVSQLANVLISLHKYSPSIADDIIIYHDGIGEDKQRLLRSIGLPLIFINYTLEVRDKIVDEAIEAYSTLAFSRYECFSLLDSYIKVIWLDIDILIQKDISGLLEYGDKTGFACTKNDCGMLNFCNFYEPIPGYSMYDDLYNSGVLVFKDILPGYQKFKDWCYQKTEEFAESLKWPDQGILNLLIQEFSIDLELIDILRYHCHPDRKSFACAELVHSYGPLKFWNSMERDFAFPEWTENNLLWQKIVEKECQGQTPRVTVLMSVYERTQFLEESVMSMLNQTLSEFELLVVIEYSPYQEDIERILKSFADNRIIIIKNTTRLGFAASLNVGLENARGEYIARMDDDDYSVPERLQVQVDFMDANPDIGISGTYVKCFDKCFDVWDKVSLDHESIKVRLLTETQLYHPTVMMRKSLLDKHSLRYDPSAFTEDYDLWARAAAHLTLANIPKILVRYRSSGTNATLNFSHKVQQSHLSVMRMQIENNLGVIPSIDELLLFSRRIDVIRKLPETLKKEAKKQKSQFIGMLYKANKEKGYYDQEILEREYGPIEEAKMQAKEQPVLTLPLPEKKPKPRRSWAFRKIRRIVRIIANHLEVIWFQKLNAAGIKIKGLKDVRRYVSKKVDKKLNKVSQPIRELRGDVGRLSGAMQELDNNVQGLDRKFIELYQQMQQILLERTGHVESMITALQHTQNSANERSSVMSQDAFMEVHTHIDWVQRDILVALKERIDFNKQQGFSCITDYPVAYDSPDHIHPIGTLNDHTRHPRFVRACEQLFPDKKMLSFLDLGCSAGGMVWDAILRGHIGVGLEGSDISLLQQRAEWRLLKESLFTCDIGKPFLLTRDGSSAYQFDVISAWEVLEHLTRESLHILFTNLSTHMHADSIFACSISQIDGGFTDDGKPLHQTIEPLSWWQDLAQEHGLIAMNPSPLTHFDYARGNGNPSIYYRPNSSYREQPNDCELVVFKKL